MGTLFSPEPQSEKLALSRASKSGLGASGASKNPKLRNPANQPETKSADSCQTHVAQWRRHGQSKGRGGRACRSSMGGAVGPKQVVRKQGFYRSPTQPDKAGHTWPCRYTVVYTIQYTRLFNIAYHRVSRRWPCLKASCCPANLNTTDTDTIERYCSRWKCRSMCLGCKAPGVHHEWQMAQPRRTRGAAEAHDAGWAGRAS